MWIKTIIVALLILASGGIKFVPFFAVNSVTLFCILLYLSLSRQPETLKRLTPGVFLFAVVVFLVMAANLSLHIPTSSFSSYILMAFYLGIALLASITFSPREGEFVQIFERLLRVVVVLTLLSLPLQIAFHSHLGDWTVEGMSYASFLRVFNYSSQTFSVGGFQLYRVCLFFWEPGVLQVYLNMFLYLLTRNGADRKWILPTCTAIVLTFSTTGLLVMMVILFSFFWPILRRRKLRYGVAALVLIAAAIPLVGANLANKFQGADVSSTLVRYYDFEMGASILIDNPIAGIGMMGSDGYSSYRSTLPFTNLIGMPMPRLYRTKILDRPGGGTTNSMMDFADSFGVIGLLLVIIGAVRQTFFPGNRWIWGAILILSINSEPLLITPFFATIFVSRLVRRSRAQGAKAR